MIKKEKKVSFKSIFCISVVIILSITLFTPVFVAEGRLSDSSWPKINRNNRNTGRLEEGEELTNQTQWTFETGDMIDGSPVIGPDGSIYIGSYDGHLYALREDGTEIWSYNASSAISSTPVVAENGMIYFVTVDGELYSLNDEGEKNWMRDDLIGRGRFGEAVISSPVIREDGSILVASQDVYSVRPDGTEEWNYTHKFEGEDTSSPGVVQSSPAVDEDGDIFFGYNVYTPNGYIGLMISLDSEGEERWEYPIKEEGEWELGSSILSSPALNQDGDIYFGSHDDRLYSLDSDGEERWNYSTAGSISSSPALGEDGTIYVGSEDGNLYALTPDGEREWNFETGGEVYSSPAVGPEGMIYFGSYDNHTYSVYPNGTERWRVETGDSIFSSPALDSDGRLYIASFDQKIYSIGEAIEMEDIEDGSQIPQMVIPIIIIILFLVLLAPSKS